MGAKYVAVTGIMGSGKTTLAKNLARHLGWEYLPQSRNAVNYLGDLFSNPSRWAFDAQLSFFTEKALQIKQAASRGSNIVLDRSLLEDTEIFARYFRDKGFIEDRGYLTYSTLTEYFMEELPIPSMYIYCDISIETVKARLATRSREIDNRYTNEHIEEIYNRYKSWIGTEFNAQIYSIDSERFDFRETSVMTEIGHEIEVALRLTEGIQYQYDLFLEELEVPKKSILKTLQYISGQQIEISNNIKPPSKTKKLISSPYVYIAAPFTIMAGDIDSTQKISVQADIFDTEPMHGRIKSGRYRNALNAILNFFENLNVSSLLPHRDVNDWGKKSLNQYDVFSLCTQHVINCDLFFGLLGQSTGAHYEYGLAKARSKPSILLHCAELNDSFIAEGVPSDGFTLILRCDRINQIKQILNNDYVYNFLHRHNLISLQP